MKQRGISLIALIITIIVIIILAMITIFGVNGIVEKANQAREEYERVTLEEDITAVLAKRKTYQLTGTMKSLKEDLEQELSGPKTVEELASDTCYVTRGTQAVTVYEDGTIFTGKTSVWDGETAEASEVKDFHWYIYNAEQFKFFADFVNNGNALTAEQKTLVTKKGYNEADFVINDDTIVYLMADIDLGARQKDGELTEGTAWTPIGPTPALKFTGTFEGNNHVISGVYVKVDKNDVGLFGNSNTIQNLTIRNSYIENTGTTGYTGGVVASIGVGNSNLFHCHNLNTVVINNTNKGLVGGVIGSFRGNNIENCSNTGNISSGGNFVGGIMGAFGGKKLSDCQNSGQVLRSDGILWRHCRWIFGAKSCRLYQFWENISVLIFLLLE